MQLSRFYTNKVNLLKTLISTSMTVKNTIVDLCVYFLNYDNFWIIIFAFFRHERTILYYVQCTQINIMKIQKQRFCYNEIAARRRFSDIDFFCLIFVMSIFSFSTHFDDKKCRWFKWIRIICSIQSCCGNEGQWLSHGSHFFRIYSLFFFHSRSSP